MKNNKNKGFTLIELIIVIAIIGLLATIVTTAIVRYIHKAKDNYNNTLEETLKVNAEDYLNDYSNELPLYGEEKKIKLDGLIANNYLSSEMKDYDKNSCSNSYVYVRNVRGKYEYHPCLICGKTNYSSDDKYCTFTGDSTDKAVCSVTTPYVQGTFSNKDVILNLSGTGVKYFEVNNKMIDAKLNSGTNKFEATTSVSSNSKVQVVAYSDSGIKSSCGNPIEIKFDKTNPTCSIVSLVNGNDNYSKILKITGNDTISGVKSISINSIQLSLSNNSGTYLARGNGKYIATITDNANNQNTCSVKVSDIPGDLFEGNGPYNFAVAGSPNIEVKQLSTSKFTAANFNNSIYSNGQDYIYLGATKVSERKFIKNKTGIAKIDNDSTIRNISGSKLTLNGQAKKAYLYIHTNVNRSVTSNFATLISATGEKLLLTNSMGKEIDVYMPTDQNVTVYTYLYDVTSFVQKYGSGWYYVYLNNAVLNGVVDHETLGWGMLAVDELNSYPYKHVKIVNNNKWARNDANGNEEQYFTVNTDATINKNISSTIDFAGIGMDAEPWENTANQMYLVSGNTKYKINQLKDANNIYYFPTRSNVNGFLSSICDTTRITSYRNCYEFDIFNGKLPASLLTGQNYVEFKLAVEFKGGGVVIAPLVGIGVNIPKS